MKSKSFNDALYLTINSLGSTLKIGSNTYYEEYSLITLNYKFLLDKR